MPKAAQNKYNKCQTIYEWVKSTATAANVMFRAFEMRRGERYHEKVSKRRKNKIKECYMNLICVVWLVAS